MSVLTRNNIVTNGLVLYLDAANRQSYISGSTTFSNIIGTGSLTLSNVGAVTTSFQTNPDNIYITQPSNSSANGLSGLFPFSENSSIELWYRTLTTGSGIAVQTQSPGIFQIGGYNQNASLTLWDWSQNTPGNHLIRTFVNNGTTWSHTAISTTTYSDAVWVGKFHHIVMNFSGSAGKWNRYNLYIDGTLQTTINFTIPFPSASLGSSGNMQLPGAGGGSASNNYSILKVYNRELTYLEITQNYNALKTRFNLQ